MYKVCKRPPTISAVQSTPHVRGDFKKCSRLLKCKRFQSTPRRATSGAYLVSSRTAAVNPTAKACFCQSSYRASNSGFSFPLDFCRLVCYHRFSSVSALCWVVSAVFGGRGTYSLIFCLGTARQSNYGLLLTVLCPALCKSHPALQA